MDTWAFPPLDRYVNRKICRKWSCVGVVTLIYWVISYDRIGKRSTETQSNRVVVPTLTKEVGVTFSQLFLCLQMGSLSQ